MKIKVKGFERIGDGAMAVSVVCSTLVRMKVDKVSLRVHVSTKVKNV